MPYSQRLRFGGNHPKWCYQVLEAASAARQPLLFEYSHSIRSKVYYGVPRNVRNASEWISLSVQAMEEEKKRFDAREAEKKAAAASKAVEKLASKYGEIEVDMQALNDLLKMDGKTGVVIIDLFGQAEKHPDRVFARFLTRDGRLAEITYGIAASTHWMRELDILKAAEVAESMAR